MWVRVLGCFVVLSFICLGCSNDDGIQLQNSSDQNPQILEGEPCVDGLSSGFPCDGVELLSRIPLGVFSASSGNDSWGWVDPQTNQEYALMGLNNGLAFIDVTNPSSPIYLGKLPTKSNSSQWRDVKVYRNYAFIVAEAANHGMQIFDLTKLRNVSTAPQTFTEDAHYNGFGNAHNIVINEDSGYAYAVGTQTFSGGPHFVDIRDPLNPTAAGGYATNGYSHDAQVVTYNGPDQDYQGAEILIGSNENEVVIVNVSDKNAPVEISRTSYPQIGYTHQGWFTDDQRYFIAGDELDELNFGIPSRTLVFDFLDLDAPTLFFAHQGETNAIDHNGYVHNGKFYLSNYTAGIRIFNLDEIQNGLIQEESFFDTVPSTSEADFTGVWNIYIFLPSGTLIVSDIRGGLFLLKEQL